MNLKVWLEYPKYVREVNASNVRFCPRCGSSGAKFFREVEPVQFEFTEKEPSKVLKQCMNCGYSEWWIR
jgi:ribosomal protein S27AE